jgi:hypothetical protein
MIRTSPNTNASTSLVLLQTLPYDFYLTGSRFFGNPTKESDWDFYCEYNENLIDTLKDHGFRTLIPTTYRDANTSLVLRRDNVDIQFVKDFAKKHKVQSLLLQLIKHFDLPLKDFTKLQRVQIWDNLGAALTNK